MEAPRRWDCSPAEVGKRPHDVLLQRQAERTRTLDDSEELRLGDKALEGVLTPDEGPVVDQLLLKHLVEPFCLALVVPCLQVLEEEPGVLGIRSWSLPPGIVGELSPLREGARVAFDHHSGDPLEDKKTPRDEAAAPEVGADLILGAR